MGSRSSTPSGRDAGDRRTLFALLAGFGLVAALIVLPYLQYVLLAILLAYVLYPLQRRLRPLIGRTAAASVLIVLATVAVLLPIGFILWIAVEQAIEIADALVAGDRLVTVHEVSVGGRTVEVDLAAVYEVIRNPVTTLVRGMTDEAVGFLGGVTEALIGLTILLFALFSLLRDGDRLIRWLGRVVPLREPVQAELLERLDDLAWAAIVGNVAVAGVQAVLTTIGLAVVGFPALVFFGLLTFLLALLPLIGASVVWIPAAIYLAVVGRPIAALALFVYGSVVVSLSDNYLRPITVGRGADLNVGIVIVGIFGGIVVFGFVGLFVGPIVLGGFKTVLEVYARERRGKIPAVAG